MVHQKHNKYKRKRLSTSGSYHSALEESDYENDIGEELEEAEKGPNFPTKSFGDDILMYRNEKQRSFYTIAFLLGVVCALITVIVIDNIKNGTFRSSPAHFELLPHLDIQGGISNFASEENWTRTQLVNQKQGSITKSTAKSKEGSTAAALKSLSVALLLKKKK